MDFARREEESWEESRELKGGVMGWWLHAGVMWKHLGGSSLCYLRCCCQSLLSRAHVPGIFAVGGESGRRLCAILLLASC
jgi:hypothetical protein